MATPAKRKRPRAATGALADRLRPEVVPPSATRARARLADLAAAAEEAGCGGDLARVLATRPDLARLLAGVLDASPFLRGLILEAPGRLLRLLAADPNAALDALVGRTAAAWRDASEAALMTALREARAEAALLIGLADLGGVFGLDAVTGALTRFADAALGAGAAFVLAEEGAAGRLDLPDPRSPSTGSGWVVLGMGKYGAGELNYSSDVDLIVLYDLDAAPLAAGVEAQPLFVRMTRRLVKLLQEHTADGYVFRTDLRLRPDPGSTPVALSTVAALHYYESRGQNWERAALIKARPVAGDRPAGEAFLAELVPYVWRKYLDYAAIADIHSIKRQIHDHRGHGEVAVAGHNIKLGRGGIREIEFFVQTQQLIAGGRDPALRGRRTLDMLAALNRAGWIDAAAADDLDAAYRGLRSVEHRLQMIADEQTHTIPDGGDALAAVARLAGRRSVGEFASKLRPVLETVRDHYARLFEAAPSLSAGIGSLVFTGDDDDPDTVATLARLGYSHPADVIATVRGWHFGRYPAMHSATARERLTEITPALLGALAEGGGADAAFAAFDRFLARLPAGVQLFSILGSNPGLLSLLATILGTAPRLADTIMRRPHVLDGVLDPAFFGRLPDRKALDSRLREALGADEGYEAALDRARVFGQEQMFLIGARVLAGAIGTRQAGAAYADLAEVIVADLFDRVSTEFERAHGRMPGGRAAILAMGKFGGREMSAGSDLDLILLYDFEDDAIGSDGPRPLAGSQYYARLTQRLVAALSAPTAEGSLYEVDFRLRPSGNAGPLASGIASFAAYQKADAWTWEHMALTRARPVAGDRALGARAARIVRGVLTAARDRAKLARDVAEMRALVEAEKGGGPWDLKQAAGGLVDVEFIAQALQLAHAAERPEILSTETEAALSGAAAAGLLAPGDAELLLSALRLYQGLTTVMRLCVDGPFDPKAAPRGLLDLLARTGELPDFRTLDAALRDTERSVRRLFVRLVGPVAPPKPAART